MAIIFAEGFDWLHTSQVTPSSTDFSKIWDGNVEIGNNTTFGTAFGRFGGFGVVIPGTGNWHYKDLPSNYGTLFASFACGVTSAGGSGGVIMFGDAGTDQVQIRLNTSRILQAYRGNTLLGTASGGTIPIGSLVSVEVKVVFHGSTGSVTIKVDGTQVLNLTGQNTIQSANAYANRFVIGANSNIAAYSAGLWLDDIVVYDTVDQSVAQPGSPANNDFLGDVRVVGLMPNGNGNSSQWVGSDSNSTDNYALVDEKPGNSDTDYVASGTTGDKDTYAFENLSLSGTVFAVMITAIARKDDAGARNLLMVARSGGTDQDSAASQALSSSYKGYFDVRGAKPGAAAWTVTDVNNGEFGIKVA